MSQIDAAIVKEQNITFAIVVVKQYIINSSNERKQAVQSFSTIFPNMPIVLMAQNPKGIPTYWGRTDIVNFLSKVSVSRIPWKRYTVN